VTDPLLVDVPTEIATERLLLRPPRPGDGPAINAAVCESFPELNRWMPWAREPQSQADSEAFARRSAAEFVRREQLPMLLFLADGTTLVGSSGLHHIDWTVPRFEIGYWCRTSCTGRGYVREAVTALTRMAFTALGAARVEIRMDATNARSWRVAERLGFALEGVLRRDARGTDGALRDTRVYALTRLEDLRP
jgi:RimJ/RimL family protein N-acetyltransferase